MNNALKSSTARILAHLALFAAVVVCAYFARYHHFRAEMEKYPGFMPFTRESAMMYSYALDVAEGRGIPEYDNRLAGLDKVRVSEQDSVGLEYFIGYGYRLKKHFSPPGKQNLECEDNPDFTSWARFQMRLWISLTAGLILLWLIQMRCRTWTAVAGALLYAVAPAAIARATGQDLIRELFCIPFIVLFFLLYSSWMARPRRLKLILSGGAIFAALATWDMSQLIFALWGVYEIARILAGGILNRKRKYFLIFIYLSAVVASVTVPYLRVHGFIVSPAMALVFPLLLILSLPKVTRLGLAKKIAVFAVSAILLGVFWAVAVKFTPFKGNYNHFLSLVISKVKFMNVKPADPSLLDFDSRILWTPALHSATCGILRAIFPAGIYFLAILAAIHIWMNRRRRSIYSINAGMPLFMSIAFFILFIFMVRFHVICTIFLCVSICLLFNTVYENTRTKKWRVVLALAFLLTLAGEMDISLKLVQAGGRSYEGEYPTETEGLVRWFREADLKGRTILCNFTLSPMLKGYCGSRVVLLPKFELPQTRNDVEEYYEIMFKGTENKLRDFCGKYDVEFIIYDRGYNAPPYPYSARYCANAVNFGNECPVFRFYQNSEKKKLRYFYEVYPPKKYEITKSKYTVFMVISKDDSDDALKYVAEGRKALKEHNIMKALEYVEKAIYKDPFSLEARIFYAEIHGKAAEIDLKRLGKIKWN